MLLIELQTTDVGGWFKKPQPGPHSFLDRDLCAVGVLFMQTDLTARLTFTNMLDNFSNVAFSNIEVSYIIHEKAHILRKK